ncbi:hypothetical protein GH741_08600 [Aquibacillus halophilus]|uniref:Uncharacterized protein n=1 Tax=Aquibacillus halophilus TaxID=930132 RepID=A0A6A8DE02_9BACI|nr:hypothetical protein [Aquibacillus halophilus]MRH42746.1 hypothetical protein [Aquibacillus halophilus]
MWVFYVNRGQGIASFVIQDKDHAITEFFPSDKSYQSIFTQGFRTFIKFEHEGQPVMLEPFSVQSEFSYIEEKMEITENRLVLSYENKRYGVSVKFEYFTLPHAPVAGLVRHVTIPDLLHGASPRGFTGYFYNC